MPLPAPEHLRVCYRGAIIPAVEGLVAQGPDRGEEIILCNRKSVSARSTALDG